MTTPLRSWLGKVLLVGITASAQAQRFEVASIKPCKADAVSGRGSGGANLSGGRLHLPCTTVKGLVQMAYVLFANGRVNPPWSGEVPISGGPGWINSERYEIDAKPEEPQSPAMMRGPMLQSLLEDRFHLKIRRTTGEVPVYELTVAKGGVKMQELKKGSCVPVDFDFLTQFPPQPLPDLPQGQSYCGGVSADGGRWVGTWQTENGPNVTLEARGMSLDEFSKIAIGGRLDRPVVNRTGMTQRFVFHLEFAPDQDPAGTGPDDPGRGPSIFTALQEQLGLKLVPAKGPGEFLVIDHVDRPSEN